MHVCKMRYSNVNLWKYYKFCYVILVEGATHNHLVGSTTFLLHVLQRHLAANNNSIEYVNILLYSEMDEQNTFLEIWKFDYDLYYDDCNSLSPGTNRNRIVVSLWISFVHPLSYTERTFVKRITKYPHLIRRPLSNWNSLNYTCLLTLKTNEIFVAQTN